MTSAGCAAAAVVDERAQFEPVEPGEIDRLAAPGIYAHAGLPQDGAQGREREKLQSAAHFFTCAPRGKRRQVFSSEWPRRRGALQGDQNGRLASPRPGSRMTGQHPAGSTWSLLSVMQAPSASQSPVAQSASASQS